MVRGRRARVGDVIRFTHRAAAHKVKGGRPGVVVAHADAVLTVVVGVSNEPRHTDYVLVPYERALEFLGLDNDTYFDLRGVCHVPEDDPSVQPSRPLPRRFFDEILDGLLRIAKAAAAELPPDESAGRPSTEPLAEDPGEPAAALPKPQPE